LTVTVNDWPPSTVTVGAPDEVTDPTKSPEVKPVAVTGTVARTVVPARKLVGSLKMNTSKVLVEVPTAPYMGAKMRGMVQLAPAAKVSAPFEAILQLGSIEVKPDGIP